MPINNSNRGFTLIELVTFIVVGGIFLPASIIALTSVLNNLWAPDYRTKARLYAEERIESITSNPYSKTYLGRSVPTGIIPDPSSELALGFGRTWSVCYVPYDDISYDRCDISTETNYQRINVVVTDPSGTAYGTSTLTTLRPKAAIP